MMAALAALHLAKCACLLHPRKQRGSFRSSALLGLRPLKRGPALVSPRVLAQILGVQDVHKLLRVQLARMQAGSAIQPHSDKGGYAEQGHRIHIPLTLSASTLFLACPVYAPDPQLTCCSKCMCSCVPVIILLTLSSALQQPAAAVQAG